MNKRIEREKTTVSLMIGLYCNRFHRPKGDLCQDCTELQHYALGQTENCRFGSEKPVCSACPVHCYRRDMRDRIREVMRYAGPRMIWRYPRLAFLHMVDRKRDEIIQSKFNTYNIK